MTIFISCSMFCPVAVSEFSYAGPEMLSSLGLFNHRFSQQFATGVSHPPPQLPNLFHSLEAPRRSSSSFTGFLCVRTRASGLTGSRALHLHLLLCTFASIPSSCHRSFGSPALFVFPFHQACPGPPCLRGFLLPPGICRSSFLCLQRRPSHSRRGVPTKHQTEESHCSPR